MLKNLYLEVISPIFVENENFGSIFINLYEANGHSLSVITLSENVSKVALLRKIKVERFRIGRMLKISLEFIHISFYLFRLSFRARHREK
jgi:hypothetical protein